MKKRVLATLMVGIMVMGSFVGCSSKNGDKKKDGMKVGMVTDSGTIDDKSFNQGTWEGILQAEEELGVTTKYLQPTGQTPADYTKELNNLYDSDFKFVITPGFMFETAIFKAQNEHEDSKYVLIDGSPRETTDSKESVVGKNTVSIFYAEHESGFLAGVATALQLKEGDLGFIGGARIPPVQKFNWGFQQGVNYANKELGTKVTIKKENVVYQGTFSEQSAGQQIAAQMYDRGVKAIFTAAGGVGVGAITEAKSRAKKGEAVWIVGVDVDQYASGIYEGEKSVILTSATKSIKKSAYDMIKAELEGKFPGGQTLIYDVKNDGVGLPEKNPNLSEDTIKKVGEIYNKIKDGSIKVSSEQGDLIEQ